MKALFLAQFDRSLRLTIPLALFLGFAMVFIVEGLLEGLRLLRSLTQDSGLPFWSLPIFGGVIVGGLLFLSRRATTQGLIDIQNYTRTRPSSLHPQSLSLKDGVHSILVHATALSCATYSGFLGPLVYFSGWIGKHVHGLVPGAKNSPAIIERHVMGSAIAAALGATLNAPLAAVFFAYEVILRQPDLKRLFPIVLAALVASLTERYFFADKHAFFELPLQISATWEYGIFMFMGLVAGGLAVVSSFGVLSMQEMLQRYAHPPALGPILGGLMLALLLFLAGDNIPSDLSIVLIVQMVVDQREGWAIFLILPLLCLAVIISVGAGYGSGVFGPSLFIGAVLGGCFWTLLSDVSPDSWGWVRSDMGSYVLVGMASFAAAVMGAPFFAVMLAFEMSLSYSVASAVMLAGFLSAEVMSGFCAPSLFHLLRGTKR